MSLPMISRPTFIRELRRIKVLSGGDRIKRFKMRLRPNLPREQMGCRARIYHSSILIAVVLIIT
jgi:hypothetical protein